MSSELAVWTNSQTTNLEKRHTAQETSRKTKKGKHPDEFTGAYYDKIPSRFYLVNHGFSGK